jgi:hypothetical protein
MQNRTFGPYLACRVGHLVPIWPPFVGSLVAGVAHALFHAIGTAPRLRLRITATNRIYSILFAMQNRTVGPYMRHGFGRRPSVPSSVSVAEASRRASRQRGCDPWCPGCRQTARQHRLCTSTGRQTDGRHQLRQINRQQWTERSRRRRLAPPCPGQRQINTMSQGA